jgi:hypothetical protein
MHELTKRLASLINVKTMVTFAIIAVFVVLALRGDIQASDAMQVTLMVIAFYFGTQHEKKE